MAHELTIKDEITEFLLYSTPDGKESAGVEQEVKKPLARLRNE